MRQHRVALRIAILSIAVGIALASPSGIADELDRGEDLKVEVADLDPTQFDVGMREVEIRKAKILALMSDRDALKSLMKENRATVVVGPGKKLYIVDGHHFLRALYELGIEKAYIHIDRNWDDLSPAEFWKKMKEKNWTYLKRQDGRAGSYSNLPKSIAGMGDDAYRSLAWFVRKAGGYEALEIPFQEFQWAAYFRKKIPMADPSDSIEFERAFKKALQLASSQEAAELPGYTGKKVSAKCSFRGLLKRLEH